MYERGLDLISCSGISLQYLEESAIESNDLVHQYHTFYHVELVAQLTIIA
jgi:hypothetical protein